MERLCRDFFENHRKNSFCNRRLRQIYVSLQLKAVMIPGFVRMLFFPFPLWFEDEVKMI